MAEETAAAAPDVAATPSAAPAADAPAPSPPPTLLSDPAGVAETPKEGEPAAEPKEGEGDKKAEGAPEEYKDFELPKGFELDKEALGQFTPIAKDLNLNQEQAQKLVTLFAEQRAREAEASATAVKAMNDGWIAAAKADPEIGGAKFDENLGVAKKGLEAIGTPALLQYLNESGAGNNPEVIRAFVKIGKMVSEDKFVTARSGSQERDAASVLYPNLPK